MKDQKINVSVQDGVQELVLRQGEAEPVAKFRKGIKVQGAITVPRVHLTNPPKALTSKGLVIFENSKDVDSVLSYSYLEVDRDHMSLTFVEDAGNEWQNIYFGILKFTDVYLRFGINSDKTYSTLELASFIKMNRSHFESKEVAMSLVKDLQNFKAKVDKQVELQADDRANHRALISQAVDSNIPEKFSVKIPVFKGEKKQTIELEIAIEPVNFECRLISPEANDYVERVRDEILDSEVDKIKELHPELRIFEV